MASFHTPPAYPQTTQFQRQLGDSEISYFLPSREAGVNDMYLHLGFTAPTRLLQHSRLCLVWAILRLRHPLLASKIIMVDYDDIKFVYTPPASVLQAIEEAVLTLDYRNSSKEELLDGYLNGPRTLSNERLSYMVISQSKALLPTPPASPTEFLDPLPFNLPLDDDTDFTQHYDLFFAAVHAIGDGMALHNFANEFFSLLGNSQMTDDDLSDLLLSELQFRWHNTNPQGLPAPVEGGLFLPKGRLSQVVSRVDFDLSQGKLIGGHSFPKRSGISVQTVVPTVPINAQKTKQMLKVCKAHGVSISSAVFAVCNLAWARTYNEKRHLPVMLYSAINLRPYISPSPMKPLNNDVFFLSIGYFNVVLPSFFPGDKDSLTRTFWHRARVAKEQSAKAVKYPFIVERSRLMAEQRARRAKIWAKEDDQKAQGTFIPSVPSAPSSSQNSSVCLTGISLLGNLDGIYNHSAFPDIKFNVLTTGSRQRSGGMLMFAYTFVGLLWVSLGYDQNGFDDQIVEKFWVEFLRCMDEFLLEDHGVQL